jgi:type I restriction enzyme M protein
MERRTRRKVQAGQQIAHVRRFNDDEQNCRWETWRHYGAEDMLPHVRDRVFRTSAPGQRSTGADSQFAAFMKDAQMMIQKPSLLVKAVNAVQDLPLDRGDTKGDLYEYLLSKLTTAGINGQFRTPRHIIRLMVELMEPQPTDRICDPACGTAGFLIEVRLPAAPAQQRRWPRNEGGRWRRSDDLQRRPAGPAPPARGHRHVPRL